MNTMIGPQHSDGNAHEQEEDATAQALQDVQEFVHALEKPGFYFIDQEDANCFLVDDYEESIDGKINTVLRVMKVAKLFPTHIPAKVTLWRQVERIKLTELGRQLMDCVNSITELSAITDAVELHPRVLAFLQAARTHTVSDPMQWDPRESQPHREARLINEFYAVLARHAASKELKDKIDNYNRSAHKNYAQTVKLIDAYFERHAALLLCRLDLYYSAKCIQELGQKTPEDRQATNDLNALIAHAKSTFKGYLAHVVKYEMGLRRGAHFHVLLIFNASVHRQDITIVHTLGLHWQNTITAGTGGFYNCNGHKQRYQKLALGKIHHADQGGRKGLNHILRYLNKIDPAFKRKLEGLHAFRKSKIPKSNNVSSVKRGRPRKKDL